MPILVGGPAVAPNTSPIGRAEAMQGGYAKHRQLDPSPAHKHISGVRTAPRRFEL